MTTIASWEAQNSLHLLLRRVAQGEEIVITEEGKPVAKLAPYGPAERNDVPQIIEEFKSYSRRQGRTLGGLTAQELIEEGRRYY
ncbi:MAG TPA: type II toxin-antitoxin system prevent-host-death family antitoxin [Planctomycetales bacterium]|jgi:prevent-host-death family protein|nr:type II toxin-antitoxin system prevent-host-death family antitoxin [Planctomycetales bacterium]